MGAMVKFLFVAMLLLFSRSVQSQNTFFITAVSGSITISSGVKLTPGMTIAAKEQLTFNDSLAAANAIDDRSVIFILKPIYMQAGYSDAANMVASPARKSKSSSLEMFIPDYPISDLGSVFGNEQIALIEDVTSIPINSSKIKLGNNEMVVFSFKDQGKNLSYRIPIEKGALLVDRRKFWNKPLHGTIMIDNVDVYIVNVITKKYTELSSTRLILVNKSSITAEMQLVNAYLRTKDINRDLSKSYLTTYFYAIYGCTMARQLNDLVDSVINR